MPDLSRLTITSKSLRNLVENFRCSRSAYFRRKRASVHDEILGADIGKHLEKLKYHANLGKFTIYNVEIINRSSAKNFKKTNMNVFC